MTRFVVLSLLALFAVGSARAEFSIPYEMFRLENGLTVILHEDHSVPMIAVNLSYHVGSGREKPGRTGLAHLFEHLMYEGSAHVPEGKYDEWLEAAGGENNGSTGSDDTNYWINVPSNALDLALFLESDRMGYLVESMSPARVDGQRDVVKNERRQSNENRPYGMAWIVMAEQLFPPGHPYSWDTIGSMEDLSAAAYEDVVEFFESYYGPNNASLCIAGDIDPVAVRASVERWFSDVPAGPRVAPLSPPVPFLEKEKRLVMEDEVQLPRIYMNWHTPRKFAPGDAEMDLVGSVLAGGRNSRLHKRLVYEMQIAQDISAFQYAQMYGSSFHVIATARAGHTLAEIEAAIQEEIDRLRREPPSRRELERAVNQYQAWYLAALESVGGFGGKAALMNGYYAATGNPDYFQEDLSRYLAIGPDDVRTAAAAYLRDDARFIMSIVPEGQRELAAPAAEEEK